MATYNPPEGLDEFERNILGQAMNGRMSDAVRELHSLWPEIVKLAKDLEVDLDEVKARELETLRRIYAVLERFIPAPLPFEFFERQIGW